MKKCEHDLIEDECFQCLRAALEALYEAANTKDRVSLEDLEAAYDALNR